MSLTICKGFPIILNALWLICIKIVSLKLRFWVNRYSVLFAMMCILFYVNAFTGRPNAIYNNFKNPKSLVF